MSEKSFLKLEWISLVYLLLFVLAVLAPSLVTRGFFGIGEQHLEEVMIFIFGVTGLATFAIYQRVMEGKEKEHEEVKTESERIRRELVESYKYIGSVNRQIELLKRLANETSQGIIESDRLRKDLLSSLMASAAASVGAPSAFIRYVEILKNRTEFELAHAPGGNGTFKIANKDLLKLHQTGAAYAYIRSEEGQEMLVVPSDHKDAPIKAFLVITTDSSSASSLDPSLLKVFANQAELLYHTLGRQTKPAVPSALDLVEQAAKQAVGDVA